MKTVIYMNQSFDVPLAAKFIAADSNGDVYAYNKEPRWDDMKLRYVLDESEDDYEVVGCLPAAQPRCEEI